MRAKIYLVVTLVVALYFMKALISNAESLKEVFEDKFLLGVAMGHRDLGNLEIEKIVNREFNSVVAEYGMKMSNVMPREGVYDFTWSDRFLNFAMNNGHYAVGHVIVWHKNIPEWFFLDGNGEILKRDELLMKLKQHINTYVGRYRGQVHGWDVVNEAFNDDGSFRKTPWFEIIGDDYIEKAFEFTHEADPNAELYYNDYGLVNVGKQNSIVALIKRLKKKGIPISAVGIQGHYSLDFPDLKELDRAITRFSELDTDVMITELDISVLPFPDVEKRGQASKVEDGKVPVLNPYLEALPDDITNKQSRRYEALFCIFMKHQTSISRVSFWGITDERSWRNNWPVVGRVDYPLLFDRELQPKKAFFTLKNMSSFVKENCE